VNQYVIVVEFCFSLSGAVFYMAHIFELDSTHPDNYQTFQLSVTADSPKRAIEKASDVLWLLR